MRSVSNTLFTGKVLHTLQAVDSTNTWLQQYVLQHQAAEGLVVVTESQFAGKGQQGAQWQSDPGKNLLMSVLFKPGFLLAEGMFLLNKAMALAVRSAVQEFTAEPVWIKWPNDIYVREKKIAGILIETVLQGNTLKHCIVGVGLNVNQQKFDDTLPFAISLFQIIGKSTTMQSVLDAVCTEMENAYLLLKSGNDATIDAGYHKYLFRKDTVTEFAEQETTFFGKITGVNNAGKLLVQVGKTLREFNAKQIRYK